MRHQRQANDDQSNFLLKFESGVLGAIEASRIAAGRKMGLTYEVIGTKGSLFFDNERLAELRFYSDTTLANLQRCGAHRPDGRCRAAVPKAAPPGEDR